MIQRKAKLAVPIIMLLVIVSLTFLPLQGGVMAQSSTTPAQAKALITQSNITSDITYLANKCEGRLLCSDGDALARAYLVQQFTNNGVAPINGSYEQPMYCEKYNAYSANVWGVIPGTDPELKDEVIVVGAHFDHLGMDNRGRIYPGANDDASGCASLLEIQKAMVALKDQVKRTVVFVAFTGEEYDDANNVKYPDFLGSRYYINNPPYPLEKTVFMLNMDMMLRNNTSVSNLTAAQEASKVQSLFNLAYNGVQDGEDTNPHISYESYGDPEEDAGMFWLNNIPQRTMWIEDNKTHSRADSIANTTSSNFKGCTDFAKLTFDLLWQLAQDPVQRAQ